MRARAKPTSHSMKLVPMCGQITPEPKSLTAALKMPLGELVKEDLR